MAVLGDVVRHLLARLRGQGRPPVPQRHDRKMRRAQRDYQDKMLRRPYEDKSAGAQGAGGTAP